MKRVTFFTYGVVGHLLFLVVFAYMAAFVGDFGALVPKTVDSGPAASIWPALMVNLALLAAFAVQHSAMARPAFKRVWTQVIPKPIERSTYVYASCAATVLLMALWQPMPGIVWNVTWQPGRIALWSLFAAGWLMVPLVSLMIHHFDLFGTRQVWLYLRGKPYTALPFRTPMMYRYVRHPLYIGWALAFWATPTMTVGHLLLAGTLTLYMVAAARVEERDLVDYFGDKYESYRERVPQFIPKLRPFDETVEVEPPAQATA